MVLICILCEFYIFKVFIYIYQMKDCKIIFNLIYLLYYHFRVPVSAIFKLAFSRTRVVSVSVLVQPRVMKHSLRILGILRNIIRWIWDVLRNIVRRSWSILRKWRILILNLSTLIVRRFFSWFFFYLDFFYNLGYWNPYFFFGDFWNDYFGIFLTKK